MLTFVLALLRGVYIGGDLLFFPKLIDMIITRRPDQALIIVGGGTLNNIERRDKEIA